jgi:competence protein CoiA
MYWVAAEEQRAASAAYDRWAAPRIAAAVAAAELAQQNQLDHSARIEALLARQDALVCPTVEWVYQSVGVYPTVRDGERIPRYAMGVPVFIGEKLHAVICPVASRITSGLAGWFSTATIVVADETERARIAKVTRGGQRFRVTDPCPSPALDAQPRPGAHLESISVREAVNRMFPRC